MSQERTPNLAEWTNRRRHVRILHEVQVTLQSESNFYTGYTFDVSAGGLFVASEELLPLGTEVVFELTLGPQVVRVPVRGRVRWHRSLDSEGLPVGMGIEFVDLHDRLRRKIEAFIEKRGDTVFFAEDD